MKNFAPHLFIGSLFHRPAAPEKKSITTGVTLAGDGTRYKARDGRIYQVAPHGNYIRITPTRPWRGKSERRQYIAARHARLSPSTLDTRPSPSL